MIVGNIYRITDVDEKLFILGEEGDKYCYRWSYDDESTKRLIPKRNIDFWIEDGQVVLEEEPFERWCEDGVI